LDGVLGPPLAEGSREWIITVQNSSNGPAQLQVAEDGPTMGRLVGTANPSTVAAGATQEVVFTVPPGEGWAIFVNPGPNRGPLMLSRDIPAEVSGKLPVTIGIGENGEPYAQAPDEPGWFGN
jgi:hypothetical protein